MSKFDLESLGQKQDIELKMDPSIGAVIVGFDGGLNYWKLMYAATYTVNEEKAFASFSPLNFPSFNHLLISLI